MFRELLDLKEKVNKLSTDIEDLKASRPKIRKELLVNKMKWTDFPR